LFGWYVRLLTAIYSYFERLALLATLLVGDDSAR